MRRKGIVWYSDCRGDPEILAACRTQLLRAAGDLPIVAVTLAPVPDFTCNIVLPLERSRLTMFKQILAGLEALADVEIVFHCEHDLMYHRSRFQFDPPSLDRYWYNRHQWRVDATTGHALHYLADQVSGLCASRELLLTHYQKRVALVEANGHDHNVGYEPGSGRSRGIDDVGRETWWSAWPDVDIRHGCNLTKNRWHQSQFRDKSTCLGWTESDSVPGWGVTEGRFRGWLAELAEPDLVTHG